MSAVTLELFEMIKHHFAVLSSSPERSSITATDITQYNITLDGKVALTFVVNLKDFILTEVPTPNDIEITIDDADVINLWQGKTTLVDLKKAVSAVFHICFQLHISFVSCFRERSLLLETKHFYQLSMSANNVAALLWKMPDWLLNNYKLN